MNRFGNKHGNVNIAWEGIPSLTLHKVHAESSNFVTGVSKSEAYKQILEQAEALFDGQRNWASSFMSYRGHLI